MKRVICLLAVVLIAALVLASCGDAVDGMRFDPLNKDKIKTVTASDAVYSSYMYVVEDEGALAELTELYNSVAYEPEPASDIGAEELLVDTLYTISYYDEKDVGSLIEPIAGMMISPKGYVLIDDEETGTLKAYKLTSSFDAERLAQLLREYDTTPDLNIVVK